ncbi:carboxypeptidase regulatory-like domain-containing protein [Sphingobacterium sp. SRCM116780]|uniref:TonB-dependent receptor n=1 Tax=Sphingobacterium sp. SRCM116780 TaxID=2907623 RepID=UPI001F21FCCC|nr:carboxypeptidase regulatory-like domain-containing protein [Sphingobacterium sp. SRCM116780]UIR55693.1 carboxypeptidase regulatory-like domain-containing protein [Sphingobacterium sp. SRCM116780]
MRKLILTALVTTIGASSTSLMAQTTQASISGKIIDDQKKTLQGASVEIRNESTGFTTKTSTNGSGDYTFKELPLGGPYTVKVKYIGFGEQVRSGYMLNQGDIVRVDVDVAATSNVLDVVELKGIASMKNKIENLGAATAVTAKDIVKLPVNGRNFTSLMDLSPLSKGDNISGQLGSSTNFTIDGMTAKNPTSAGSTTSRSGAPFSISIEAVREFKVVTNQYDVTYGRSGGGTVSAVTKSGTNTTQGNAWVYSRADWLSSQYDIRGNKRSNDFSTYQYGFSLGGPIIKDKLHYFVVWDHQQDARPLIIADIQSQDDEKRFNINKATIDQFVSIGRGKYGLGNENQYGSFDKKRGSDAVFGRIDWQINDKNLLTIRDNYTNDRNNLGLEDNTKINLYESYGNDKNIDNSLLATLRTSISPRVTNELKLQHLYTYQKSSPGDMLPSSNIPRAIVENVVSTIDGKDLSTNLQLGGHRFAQESFTNNVLQLVNNLYYSTDKINYTFGIDLMYTRAKSLYGSEVNGRFQFRPSGNFTALQNFENRTPYAFYREVPLVDDPTVKGNIFNTGAYGQLQTKLAKGLDFIGGLRLDYGMYPKSPLNELLLAEVGVRTDHKLKSFVVQPRLQMTWDVNEQHKDFLRFGAGIFASDINNYMTINNLTFDGKHFATVDVRGADVPTPDFVSYRKDYATVPTLSAFQVPTINTYAEDTKIPVIYKANLSYTHFFSAKLKAGISAFMNLGRNNYMYTDRNMVNDPFFRLANEDNRGVYVPTSAIVNGVPDWKAGRISNKFGRVLELNSKGKVNQFAVVLDASYQYYKDGSVSVSYTWNDAKDNTSYNGNVANTATLSLAVKDDPRDISKMSYSNNQFRNKVVIYGTLPTFYGVSVGVRYSGMGGTRYSLLAGGNINGDFVSGTNDLAYIFDPNNNSTASNVATGLKALLDNPDASQSLKNYIQDYMGKVAERNGGINGFYSLVDVRIAKKFNFYKTHAIEVSADVFNVGNLLKKTWGVNKSLANQDLYAVGIPKTDTTPPIPGFDTAKQEFVYRVNNSGIVTPSGNPYQFQLGLRYSF